VHDVEGLAVLWGVADRSRGGLGQHRGGGALPVNVAVAVAVNDHVHDHVNEEVVSSR
jgi:hypothetical protein